MKSFETIYRTALKRKGSSRALKQLLPEPATAAALRRIPDDRYLAAMTRCVFQTGFNSDVVVRRWGNFERAFAGFDPLRWADMGARDRKRLLADPDIVRNPDKIDAVKANARLLLQFTDEYGTAARAFAAWPVAEHHHLLLTLREEGHRLGGLTGQLFLRAMGKDSYLLTDDVVEALSKHGDTRSGTNPSASRFAEIQQTFNRWHEESDLPMCQISKIVACSTGYNHPPDELRRMRSTW